MPNYRLGIAVVTYRSTATLPKCLASIRRHSPEAVVVVVENSRDLVTVRALAEAAAPLDVEVLDPGGNVGYAKGVNLAADRIMTKQCTHLLILNPDVNVAANPLVLAPFLQFADVVAGILAPGELDDELNQGQLLTVTNAKHEITWRSSLKQAIVGSRFNGIGQLPTGRFVFVPQVDGAYMLQSVEYYRDHRLDEAFELYFEDVEYCDRARMGRGVGLVGIVVGVHSAGASAANSSGRAYLVNRVSRARYLRRKYPDRQRRIIAAPFAVELFARTLTRQAEGGSARLQAYRLAMKELQAPGSIRVLEAAAEVPAKGLG